MSLARAGYPVTLIAPGHAEPQTEAVKVKEIPLPSSRPERMLKTVWQVYRAAVQTRADIYHFHDPELLPIGLLLKLHRKRVIYDAHEDVPRSILAKEWIPRWLRQSVARLTDMIELAAASKLDAVIATTPTIATRFPPAITRLVRNFPSGDMLFVDAVPYKERDPVVAYVGSLETARGVKEIVDAMALVPRSLQARCILAGAIDPPSLARELARSPGWSSVALAGFQSRQGVVSILSRARVGLVPLHPTPAYKASLPVKLFEYMSAGIPVVASDFALWREIIEGEGCGLLVDPLSPPAIAEATTWLLRHVEEAEAMGRRGAEAVRTLYNWNHEERKLLELYECLQLAVKNGVKTREPTAETTEALRLAISSQSGMSKVSNDATTVSFVMPVRNEEQHIRASLQSLVDQSYPLSRREIIIIDGCSSDRTKQIVEEIRNRHPQVRCLDNPAGIVPTGMNIGIRAAHGKIIVRVDGHTIYPNNYAENCVRYLGETKADSVGGPCITVAADESLGARLVAAVLSNPFGVGNSKFRTSRDEGYVDTVPFGAFRKEIFDRVGMYNEKLVRNQDNDLNARIRESGGKIYLTPALTTHYHPVGSFRDLLRYTFRTSQWHVFTLRENGSSMGSRHLAPALFLLLLVLLMLASLLSKTALAFLIGLLCAYVLAGFYFSLLPGTGDSWDVALVQPFAAFCFHLAYGGGTLFGLRFLFKQPSATPIRAGLASPSNEVSSCFTAKS
jgi:glycosyltransferase involved in cell wall biosynthesis